MTSIEARALALTVTDQATLNRLFAAGLLLVSAEDHRQQIERVMGLEREIAVLHGERAKLLMEVAARQGCGDTASNPAFDTVTLPVRGGALWTTE